MIVKTDGCRDGSFAALILLLLARYEDIVREPLKQLELVSEKFNISLLSQVETFLRDHSSARWKENKSSKPG